MALPLSPPVFAITAALVEERTGLHYDLADCDSFADRLSDRAAELGLESLLEYYYFLRYDPGGDAELGALIERLVVKETYFFRELEPLRVLVRSILPELLRHQKRARLWSAACATGEEPYTLAMVLAEAELDDRVEIVASDISAHGLAKAREGVYAGRSLRSMDAGSRARHFVEEPQGRVRVADDRRRSITWRRVNLLDGDAVRILGAFDVILCRNVLIYFADATVLRVAQHLCDALRPDGLLLVGASESLLRFGTLFACEEREGAFFYRKRLE